MRKKALRIKEIFYSLQGEGKHSGRPAIFVRFSKCNLWNGKEESRATSICNFCDTDIIGTDGVNGGNYPSNFSLFEKIEQLWPKESGHQPYIIFTGGEPALQIDQALVDDLKSWGCELAIETNGTLKLPKNLDWICISPKGTATVILTRCDELKLVYPQVDCLPEKYQNFPADYYYLSPKASLQASSIAPDFTQETIQYCLSNPQWRLNLQTHKVVNIP